MKTRPVPHSAPLQQGDSPRLKKCEKRGYHNWRSAKMLIDRVTGKKGIVPTHQTCMTCGKVLAAGL